MTLQEALDRLREVDLYAYQYAWLYEKLDGRSVPTLFLIRPNDWYHSCTGIYVDSYRELQDTVDWLLDTPAAVWQPWHCMQWAAAESNGWHVTPRFEIVPCIKGDVECH